MEDIDRYLDNEMEGEARADFERRLATDPELAAALALRRRIMAALRDKESRAFRERLGRVRAAQEKKTPAPKSWAAWAAWAGFITFLVWGVYYFFPKNTSSTLPPLSPAEPKIDSVLVDTTPIAQHLAPSPNTAEESVPKPWSKAQRLALASRYYQMPGFGERSIEDTTVLQNATRLDTLYRAFGREDYGYILSSARNTPTSYRQYNAICEVAAHAAYLSGQCEAALRYTGIVSTSQSPSAVENAELLALLTYLKCDQLDRPRCQDLIKKCKANKFHAAHALASKLPLIPIK